MDLMESRYEVARSKATSYEHNFSASYDTRSIYTNSVASLLESQNLVGFDGEDQLAEFDDMDEDDEEKPKEPRPAGWSDYQSAWLEDADQEDLKSIGSEGGKI